MTDTAARRLKYAFLALVCLIGLSAGIAAFRFDPTGFARQLESGRHALRLEGDARLTLFPGLGVELGKCTLGGRGEGLAFATLDSLRLELAWLPLLLRGEAVVKGIRLRGLRADLLRDRRGATPFWGVPGADDTRRPHFDLNKFEVNKIEIAQAEIRFRDEIAGQTYALHVDSGQALISPGGIDLEARGSGFGLSGLAVSMQFAWPADKYANTLAVALNGKRGADNFDLRLVAANLHGGSEKFSAEKISLVAQLGHGDDSLDAALDLPAIAGGFDAAHAAAATLEINRAWKSGALSSKHSGAADLCLAKGWLEWPAARTEVRLRDLNKPEIARVWHGVTRFDAATFAALPGNGT